MERKPHSSPAVARKFRFTEARLAALPLAGTEAERAEYRDDTLPWLVCRVGVRDRTLYVKRKIRGKGRLVRHRLGVVGDKPLEQYKIEGEKVASALNAGKQPEAAVARAADTLRGAFDRYLAARPNLAELTVASYTSDLEQMFGWWLARR